MKCFKCRALDAAHGVVQTQEVLSKWGDGGSVRGLSPPAPSLCSGPGIPRKGPHWPGQLPPPPPRLFPAHMASSVLQVVGAGSWLPDLPPQLQPPP